MELLNIFLVIVLIALTAFFVATEFAIVKVRKSRIDQLVEEGRRNSVAARRVVTHLDEYLSACQLGITITALGLGWLGEPTVMALLKPLFAKLNLAPSLSSILSFIIAFAVITFIHVVVGELAPKTLAIQKSEAIVLTFAKPIIWFYKIMFPFIWALNGSAQAIAKMFGLHAASESDVAHSEEELRILLSESLESGEINPSEYRYVNKIFEFDNRVAKEIMVPRTEMVTATKTDTVKEFLQVAGIEKYTRYPVDEGDKDHIIGVINIKEIYNDVIFNGIHGSNTLEDYIKPIIMVIETVPINELLVKMQTEQIQMAILMDEYGGTAGLVTVEDIVEEIVGEIRDEFDMDERPYLQKIKDGHYILDGKTLISQVNNLFDTNIEDEDVDTIGGWILTQNFDVQKGDIIQTDYYNFKVLVIQSHQIKYVELKKRRDPPLETDEESTEQEECEEKDHN
ncbi:hemolysin family protein [Priestia koreensis]|uniref:hemolysin family protein n=1 Tax=Priestia koreensis TaxID=284581 RepID=UPI00203B8ACE|nr:hemolysin family protein [Priestia koreensis]MCM3004986.1 hemolysin family protein [Priestia koreensis]